MKRLWLMIAVVGVVFGTVGCTATVEPTPVPGGDVTEFIPVEQAIQAALDHANLSEDQVTIMTSEQDENDARIVYHIEFYTSDTEYDYEVDALTGKIADYDSNIEEFELSDDVEGQQDEGVAEDAANGQTLESDVSN